mmetsp:Transcript_8360/g.32976  ORF Transcript_8360/g.32976 Transcript_8360/m.32976 type:complete len:245 (-) Transcript_8360:2379-3113(-)
MSSGVRHTSCLPLEPPWATSRSIASFRLASSMNTSNSSNMRQGAGTLSPNASSRATEVMAFSPPDSAPSSILPVARAPPAAPSPPSSSSSSSSSYAICVPSSPASSLPATACVCTFTTHAVAPDLVVSKSSDPECPLSARIALNRAAAFAWMSACMRRNVSWDVDRCDRSLTRSALSASARSRRFSSCASTASSDARMRSTSSPCAAATCFAASSDAASFALRRSHHSTPLAASGGGSASPVSS